MRRKPTTPGGSGGYSNNNQQRKPRYQGGTGGGEHRSHNAHHNSGSGGRPRKNYAASREKYLAQARDALAAGDRVLAENYFQHADHCYRMMVEEGYQVRNNYTPPQQNGEHGSEPGNEQGNEGHEQGNEGAQENGSEEHASVSSQLPAFLTANFDHSQIQQPAEPVAAQSWEE